MTLMFFFKPQYGHSFAYKEEEPTADCKIKKNVIKRIKKIIPKYKKEPIAKIAAEVKKIEFECANIFKKIKKDLKRIELEILIALRII